jgi:hypothetical protein
VALTSVSTATYLKPALLREWRVAIKVVDESTFNILALETISKSKEKYHIYF